MNMDLLVIQMFWRGYSGEGQMILHPLFIGQCKKKENLFLVHCRKGNAEAKYWLDIQGVETIEAHAYNMSHADKKTVRRIILEHFAYIATEWNKFQEGKNG